MKRFDSKKWIIENKYGKGNLNEQLNPNITTGSNLDDVMFGTGSGDTPNPYYACPTGTIQTDTIPCNNNGNWGAPPIDGQFDWNGNYESFVSFCCVTEGFGDFEGNVPSGLTCPEGATFYPEGVNGVWPMNYCVTSEVFATSYMEEVFMEECCGVSPTGSADTGLYAPFCCDINAVNFGQMANGQPYGIGSDAYNNYGGGEAEQYLMANGPQGEMCNNSICQGNVNEPDSIGDPPGPGGQGAPQPIATLDKEKIKFRKDRKGQNFMGRGRDKRMMNESTINRLKKLANIKKKK